MLFRLLDNRHSGRGALRYVAWFYGTVAVVLILAGIGSALPETLDRIEEPISYLLAAAVVAGLVWTIVRAHRPTRVAFVLTVGSGMVSVSKPDGRTLASAPLTQVRIERRIWKITSRWSEQIYPVIILAVPGLRRQIMVSVFNTGFGWDAPAPRGGTPRYLCDPDAWPQMLAALYVPNGRGQARGENPVLRRYWQPK